MCDFKPGKRNKPRLRPRWNLDDLPASFMERVQFDPNGECWLWRGDQVNGYGRVQVAGFTMATHMSLAIFKGELPEQDQVAMHSCDVSMCVNPAHLSWGSQRENVHDARAKGRLVSNWPGRAGEKNNSSKLTDDQRREAVRRRQAGEIASSIAADFGVTKSTICRLSAWLETAATDTDRWDKPNKAPAPLHPVPAVDALFRRIMAGGDR